MTEASNWGGIVRKLWSTENDKFRDHLLRLDSDGRRMRFAHSVSDQFLIDYAGRTGELGSIVYGYFEGVEMHAAAELRCLGDGWGEAAEGAFSVEKGFQDKGIGTELMGRVIRAARNRGVLHLYLSCLSENSKMQRVAKKYEAELRFEYGEVIGEIVPAVSTYMSLLEEAVEDTSGFMMAVFDLRRRAGQQAA